MHRTKLLKILKRYNPEDPEEIDAKNQILNFLNSYENCFERSLQIGHMTASCWLLNESETKALLMHHKKLNRWLQLGGHADGEFDLLKVAIKEAKEESGVDDIEPIDEEIFDLDVHLIPSRGVEPAHYHFDVRFLLKTKSEHCIKSNEESSALLWIDIEDTELPTSEKSILRMFNKWNARKNLKRS